eukprot:g11125.t2
MKYINVAPSALALLCAARPAAAFVSIAPPSRGVAASSPSSSNMIMSAHEGPSSRGNFLSGAAGAIAAAGGLGVAAGGFGSAAVADQLGDLDGGAPVAMGAIKVTDGEPLSEEAARIQRKLATQAKLNGKSSSGQMTYTESRAAEEEKQQRMKDERNDKAKRRAAIRWNFSMD